MEVNSGYAQLTIPILLNLTKHFYIVAALNLSQKGESMWMRNAVLAVGVLIGFGGVAVASDFDDEDWTDGAIEREQNSNFILATTNDVQDCEKEFRRNNASPGRVLVEKLTGHACKIGRAVAGEFMAAPIPYSMGVVMCATMWWMRINSGFFTTEPTLPDSYYIQRAWQEAPIPGGDCSNGACDPQPWYW